MKSDNPLLFLPIETKVREFEPKLLFAMVAAERGYDVILGAQAAMLTHQLLFDRGLYIDKSFTVSKAPWFEELERLGNRIAAWDEEGLVYYDAETYWLMRVEPAVFQRLCRVFAWGEDQRDAICRYAPDRKGRIVATGNPRFDLLRPDSRGVYRKRAQRFRERYGPILLVNSNFSFANHYNQSADMAKMLSRYRIADVRPGFFDGLIQRHCEQFDAFSKMVPKLSDAFRDHTIIVRPHPSEGHDTWKEKTRALSNVKVTADGSVDAWIAAADAVVHSDCTTGIEAFLLDVPAVAYTVSERNDYRQPLPYELSHHVGDSDALIALLRRLTARDGQPAPLRDDASRWRLAQHHISGIDGALASERIVQNLGEVAFPTRRRSLSDKGYQRLRFLWRKILNIWRRRKNGAGERYHRHKFPGLELDEVKAAMAEIASLSGRFNEVTVSRAAPHCYYFSRKR